MKIDEELHNESYVKEMYIEPILSCLGWKNIYKYKSPLKNNYKKGNYILKEFQIPEKNSIIRPDYVLMNNKYPKVIVEAKTGIDTLEEGEIPYKDQLHWYFSQLINVKYGVLTNGYQWWFCLPRNGYNWRIKKFCCFNFVKDSIDDIYNRFMDFLYYEEVINRGKSARNAKSCVGKYYRDTTITGIADEKLLDELKNMTVQYPNLDLEQKRKFIDLGLEAYYRDIIPFDYVNNPKKLSNYFNIERSVNEKIKVV